MTPARLAPSRILNYLKCAQVGLLKEGFPPFMEFFVCVFFLL